MLGEFLLTRTGNLECRGKAVSVSKYRNCDIFLAIGGKMAKLGDVNRPIGLKQFADTGKKG